MALTNDLNGRRALVSGVSMGIGASIAKIMAQAGCDVAGCALEAADGDEAQRFIASVEGAGRRAWYESVDLAEPLAPARWVSRAVASLGGCDILISNAGKNFFMGVEGCSEADWAECLNLNLAAHWRLARAAKPWLEQGTDPVIILIASIHAFETHAGSFPYNVSKAGIVALVESLALEWGPRIRAVGIAPGWIATEKYHGMVQSSPEAAALHPRREQLHPVGRVGNPEDIAALCAFLASPTSGFISGTTLHVDGGLSALLPQVE